MRKSGAAVLCGVLAAGLLLGGCRKEEQGRVLQYQKGTYLGKPDQPLSEQTREALRQRMQYQGGRSSLASLGGGAPGPSADVRPPESGVSGAALDAARTRVQKQGGQ